MEMLSSDWNELAKMYGAKIKEPKWPLTTDVEVSLLMDEYQNEQLLPEYDD